MTVNRLAHAEGGARSWLHWMQSFGVVREEYFRRVGHDPLIYGEQAAVGLMLSAAGRNGLVGLLEFATDKRKAEAGIGYGRCDLWVVDPREKDHWGWAIEAKLLRIAKRTPVERVERTIGAAWADAGKLDIAEASHRIACTILFSREPIGASWARGEAILSLMREADWSWCISSDDDELPPMYVLFRERRRASRQPRL